MFHAEAINSCTNVFFCGYCWASFCGPAFGSNFPSSSASCAQAHRFKHWQIVLTCADNTGEITKDEVVHHFVEEIAEQNLELDESAIRESTEHLMRVVDTNKTSTIDFEEFVEYVYMLPAD